MILQQLARDAEIIVGKLPPPLHDRKPVPWIIDLSPEGVYLGIVRTTDGSGGKKDKGKEILVPILPAKRTASVKPTLLADTPVYSLGIPFQDRPADKKHAKYRALLEECAEATGSPEIKAILAFLDQWHCEPPSVERLDPAMELSDLITFRVAGHLVVQSPDVQEFWAARCLGGAAPDEASKTQCLVCGKRKPIAERLPVPLKGVPGGQSSGVPLVSINSNAFESLGLPNGKSAGVCKECGERFGKAANALLSRDDSRLYLRGVVYLFWTNQGAGFSFLTLLQKPDPAVVRELLLAPHRGPDALAADMTPFYATALTGNGGRAVVRDWLHSTLGDAKASLLRWFDRLSQVDSYGQPGKPLGIFALAASLYHNDAKEMAPQVPLILMRAALRGAPLPSWLLAQAVNRCRAEQDVTYPRAALIRAVLVGLEPGKEKQMSSLEPNETRPAYLCGRLLAVLEQIQNAANPGINTTLVDRFYGAASTAPASVFGNLLSDAQAHLSKLRRTRASAYQALQKSLEAVLQPLPEFPHTLTLQEQALFSLGYYHQRAEDRAAARERKAANEAAKAENATEGNDNE